MSARRLAPLLPLLFAFSTAWAAGPEDEYLIGTGAEEKPVSFETEDGWRIHGVLTRPADLDRGRKVPAALLVPSGGHDNSVFDTYPGWKKLQDSVVTLRIDPRGRGRSRGALESHSFTSVQREQGHLDVRAALAYLKAQRGVDTARIGIVAEEASADAAVVGAIGDPHVRVMVFLSGRLGDEAKAYLAENSQVASLGVVSKEDRPSLRDLVDVYLATRHRDSDLRVYDDVGVGAPMGSVWRHKFPDRKPIDYQLGEWFVARLSELGERRQVELESEDGYTLHADLALPHAASPERPVPGAVLLHSALGDRHVYDELVDLLTKNGIAVLNLDWRGRGQSIERGYYFDLPAEARAGVPHDVRAAADFLAARPEVDGERLSVVALVLSAKAGMIAAATDPRIKTFVVLTGFFPNEEEKRIIDGLAIPVLYVLSDGRARVTDAMEDHFAKTRPYGSQTIWHRGAAHGFHLLKTDDSLAPSITRWLRGRLAVP